MHPKLFRFLFVEGLSDFDGCLDEFVWLLPVLLRGLARKDVDPRQLVAADCITYRSWCEHCPPGFPLLDACPYRIVKGGDSPASFSHVADLEFQELWNSSFWF